MKAILFRLTAILFLMPLTLHGGDERHFLQSGDPGYDALKIAVERRNTGGWEAARLKKSMPITNMVAKELARALIADQALMPQYKVALQEAFPSEIKPIDDRYEQIKKEIKGLEKQVAKVSSKLDRFEAGMRDGLLSSRSRPSLLFSIDLGIFATENWHSDYWRMTGRGVPGSGTWTEWTLADDGYNLTWVMEFYNGYIDFTQAHLGFVFDNQFMPGIEVVIADENSYPSLSNLIFSGGGDGFDDDFYDITSLSGRKDLLKSSPGFGARGGQDIYIRKKSAGDWWPFSDTQVIATQTYNYYFGGSLNDIAFNVKLRGMPLFWPFERADPAFTNLWTFNDAADLNGYNSNWPRENSSAQSLAFNALLVGGGTLYFEAATAEWENSEEPKAYRDFAVLTTLSKSIGNVAVVLDYQHTGADFYPGTQKESAGNAAPSVVLLGPGKYDWLTVASEPTGPATNSEHISLGVTMDFPVSSVGLVAGTNMGINPSGPWISSRHMVGWPWDRRREKNGSHGFAGYIDGTLQALYNLPGWGFGTVKGVYQNWSWSQLDNYNREAIIVTEHGVGDNMARADSIKYVNFVDLRADLNIQSLFKLERPALLKIASRLRNTDEAFEIPTITDKSLLMQIASSATLNVEIPGHMQAVLVAAYEDWMSLASLYPIEYHTSWFFFQFWKDFPEFLTGLTMGPRMGLMQNSDPHNSLRSFTAWYVGISSGTSF